MLEKTVFSNQEIIEQLKNKYDIKVSKIEIEERGNANIFYIYDENKEKYVLKEFESTCNEENIKKEIKILNYLKNDGIKVPQYIHTTNGDYYFKYKNRIVILMKYIEGYTKEPNTGDYKQIMESAEILGKMIQSLEKIQRLPEINIEKWCNNSKLIEGKNKFNIMLEELNQHSNDDNIPKIKEDIKERIEIINNLEKIDFSEMKNLTMKNSHGDFSVMQFIYKNEKVEAVLDFEKAKKMPVVWEIIRSCTYIDKDSLDGGLNVDNLVKYTKKVMEYIELNEFDLKYMPYFYLIQLVSSPFGYEQYLKDNSQKELLDFAIWRGKMSKTLFYNMGEIYDKLI